MVQLNTIIESNLSMQTFPILFYTGPTTQSHIVQHNSCGMEYSIIRSRSFIMYHCVCIGTDYKLTVFLYTKTITFKQRTPFQTILYRAIAASSSLSMKELHDWIMELLSSSGGYIIGLMYTRLSMDSLIEHNNCKQSFKAHLC